jgi:predicted nuclease of predicted toxin-antitoxin system
VKFLIDECLHTTLVAVAQDQGHECFHVNWLGLSGEADWEQMPRIVEENFTFVTNNARDYCTVWMALPA